MQIEVSVKISREDDPPPISIEERIKGMKPICDGLYPHEVLLLSYAERYTTAHDHFEGFWNYRYGITDMPGLIDSMCKRGYITISLKRTIQKSTIPQIKLILKKYKLKVGGRKDDLIQRLYENISNDDLEQLFPDKYYALTQTGKEIKEKTDYIHYIHTHYIEDLDIWNLSELMHTSPSKSFKQVIWDYLENKIQGQHLKNKNYGLCRNSKFHQAQLAFGEKAFDLAIVLLMEVSYYDLSGLTNFFDDPNFGSVPTLFPYESSLATVTPMIIAEIKKCQANLGISDSELKNRMVLYSSEIHLPFHIFTIEECADILLLEMHEKKSEVRTIYKTAEDRFSSKHNKEYISMKERHNCYKQFRKESSMEVAKENAIYDPEFEREIEERLSKLDELSRREFYRIRQERKGDDVLSNKELDLLTLESMERSFAYRNQKSSSYNPSKEYLYTKWGTYEMPEPYKPKVSYGPRTDTRLIKNTKKGK